MTIIGLILTIALIGVLLWLVNTYIPMAPPVKNILNIVVVILLILWLLSVFGVLGALDVPLRVR